MNSRTDSRRGFTLVELMFVVGLIVIILAIAMPRLMPALAFGQLEGAARHLASFGKAAIAHSAFEQEPITVRIDFPNQQYWVLRWRQQRDELFSESEESEEPQEITPELLLELGAQGQGEEALQQALEMEARIDMTFRRSIEARARNVPQEGILSEIDPLFEHEFTLDDGEEEDREEVTTSLLERTRLPRGVVMESALIGGIEYAKGVVDIEITPLGLTDSVVLYLRNESEDYFTVVWDPITGSSHLYRGKESPQ